MIASDNMSENTDSSRGDARISVAKKWADRRKLQETQRRLNQDNALETNPRRSMSSAPDQANFSIPPLCVLLRRSWNQTIKNLVQHQQNVITGQAFTEKKPNPNSRSFVAGKKQDTKRIPFPSVLSVLKANAVKLQVETMAEDNEENEAGSPLNILPANCNDFTTSAVNHMSDSRSRAFLLLDFSAIVQSHTVWRKRLGIPNMQRKDVQIVYSARHNCNAKLLQLLQRLGVGLRVATKYDLAAVRAATTKKNETAILWDDTHILVKPNSFYRNLLLGHNTKVDDGKHPVSTTAVNERVIPITVGNAEEMERIHKQLYNICKRRRQEQGTLPKLDFVLKLDGTTEDYNKWKTTLQQMHEKAKGLSQTRVVGIALELGGNDGAMAGSGDAASAITTKKNDSSLLDALSVLIESWGDQKALSEIQTGAVTTESKSMLPQVHLTNPVTATEIESTVIEWIGKHRKLCNGITIDASRVLMANAAALCTRIIGVKKNESNTKNGATNSVDDEPEKNETTTIQQHLYIDDGCYGSLSNYPNEGIPLPLKSQRLMKSLSATSKELVEREQKALVNTTVWGPTCDGLDKVCSNVTLPRLCRDDWLVFADLGFCNEGTCFNGFSPPDIACCVLGANQ